MIALVRLAVSGLSLCTELRKYLAGFGDGGLAGTMQFFTQMMHFPTAFPFRAIVVEFADGLGLIIGLPGRVAAFGIFLTMTVAVAMVHSKIRFFMNWSRQQKGEGFEYDLFALTLTGFLMGHGSGAIFDRPDSSGGIR